MKKNRENSENILRYDNKHEKLLKKEIKLLKTLRYSIYKHYMPKEHYSRIRAINIYNKLTAIIDENILSIRWEYYQIYKKNI